MKIEVGKTYYVQPAMKKTVVEVTKYIKDGVDDMIFYETGWRWGEFYIKPTNEYEVELLQDALEDDDELLELSDFQEWELNSCWDSCWEEFQLDTSTVPVDKLFEIVEELQNQDELALYEIMEERGWVDESAYYYIENGITVELSEEYQL